MAEGVSLADCAALLAHGMAATSPILLQKHLAKGDSLDCVRREFMSELVRADRRWRSYAERKFLRFDISEARAMPLIWVSRLGNGVWQSVVAERIGIRAATLAQLLTQLEAANLIERRNDPRDQRAKALWLTDEGTALVAKLEEVLAELRSEVLADFEPHELETAIKILRKITVSKNKAKKNLFAANTRFAGTTR